MKPESLSPHELALRRAALWRRAAKETFRELGWWKRHGSERACVIGDINDWIRFTYDRVWAYRYPTSLLPRLKQLVADRENAARSSIEGWTATEYMKRDATGNLLFIWREPAGKWSARVLTPSPTAPTLIREALSQFDGPEQATVWAQDPNGT